MKWILIISNLYLFYILIVPYIKQYMVIRKLNKQRKEVRKMFEEMDKVLDKLIEGEERK